MLLATQCPHCFTSFRVANDQLKLHAGLVRCGSCQQTFNGIEHLLAPGEKPAQPPAVAPVIEATSTAEISTNSIASPEVFSPVQISISEVDSIAEIDFFPQVNSVENKNSQIYTETIEHDQGQNQIEAINANSSSMLEFDLGGDSASTPFTESEITTEPEAELNDEENVHAELASQAHLIIENSDDNLTHEPQHEQIGSEQDESLADVAEVGVGIDGAHHITQEDSETPVKSWHAIVNGELFEDELKDSTETEIEIEKPDFVLQAEKKQRSGRLVRISMTILSTLLFFTLLAQSAYSLRNQIAAWFPQSKPMLQELCKLSRCRIELPTQIEGISIESNELQALPGDKNLFSLAIQLQNKSNTLQNWPMLELILNDAKDRPVVRRVFTPADYLANKNDLIKGFTANSEQPIKLYFELSGPKAAGYHVGIFFP
jgi:predicted Zn finger-like uncharacterized protein